MRVGIDYLPATSHFPGAGRYARELVRALVRLDGKPEVALYEVGSAERTVPEAALGLPPGDPRVRRLRTEASRSRLRWHPLKSRRCADLALGGVDVFHHTSRELPRIARAAQTIAVAEIPEAGSLEEALFKRALARADGAIVFGPTCAKRLEVHYGFPRERVHVVAVGCDHWRRDLASPPAREEIPRILALGALRKGRRTLRLLKAFERLVDDGLTAHLHLVGGPGEEERDFMSLAKASHVHLRVVRETALPEAELAALVARSSVLVHLVDDAETPVTPLEAFSFGTAVVASRLPVFEEALGGLAQFVDNAKVDHASDFLTDAIAAAIASARDPRACQARVRHAGQYTWERNARETVAAWEAVLAGREKY
ncbi:MAG: glycosyltransferase [Planctomycetota bacterium]